MSPTLENGDRLEVERDSEVAVGDLAVFLGHEKLVAHRVVKITGQQLWVRGDNLSGSPEVVPASGVLGKVAVIHRRDGRTIDLASTGQRVWKKTWNLSPRLARFRGGARRCLAACGRAFPGRGGACPARATHGSPLHLRSKPREDRTPLLR